MTHEQPADNPRSTAPHVSQGRGGRRRGDAGLSHGRQGPGADHDALAEHLAAEVDLPGVGAGLRQEGQGHDGRRPKDRRAARRRGGAGLRPARRRVEGHARRRPRRARIPLRQADGAGALGVQSRLRHGRQHAAQLAQVRRRQAAPQQALRLHRGQRGVLPLRPDGDPAARLAQEGDHQARRLQGAQVPHGGHLDRPVHGPGRGSERAARRRDRAGHRPRPARRRRVHQRHLRPHPRLRRRPDVQGDLRFGEGLHRAGGEVGPRHQRRPPHGLQPLLRQTGCQEELVVDTCRASGQPSGVHRVAGLVAPPMNARGLIRALDLVSYWSGKLSAWLIVALTFVVSIEVFKRYILNAPTAWIFDLDNMLYGTLFMMCGAYTLAAGGHVRADFVYIYLKPRAQAGLDLALYLLFFIPGILGLIYAGYDYAALSWRIGEHSTVTAEGPPVYHFKSVIPIAGAMVMLQGFAEIARCLMCLRTGAWPARLEDVEEIDVIQTQLGGSEYVDEESRRVAMEGAHAIDEAARHRSAVARKNP